MNDESRFRIVLIVLAVWTSVGGAQSASAAAPSTKGLVLWLDAGDVNGDGQADSNLKTGARVPIWRDKSGTGNHVQQTQADQQPTFVPAAVGGKPGLRFKKSRLEKQILTGFSSGEQRFQIFLVMRAAPQASGSPVLLDLPTLARDKKLSIEYALKRKGFWLGYRDFEGTAGKLRLGIHVGDEGQSHKAAWDGSPHLLEAVYAGNQRWGMYQNGTPVGRGRFSGDNTFGGYDLGARLVIGQSFGFSNKNSDYRGDLAEVLIYNRALKYEEQNQVGHYLSAKYGLPTLYRSKVAPAPLFESDILPILARSCGDCHGKDDPEASLDLTSMVGLLRGGVSGPAILRGESTESLLLHMTATGEMPPKDSEVAVLTDAEVELFRHWLDAGAPSKEKVDPAAIAQTSKSEHWAFQKLLPPEVPRVAGTDRKRTDVDAFVLAKLKTGGLRFSPDADPVTLIRRTTLDLVGLLPTPEEVLEFEQDSQRDSEAAFAKLVERLLASPHFGERWGRHWLDGAGYTDTLPLDNDQTIVKPGLGKWKYRDYVVRSFNDDQPFADFLIEQIAGDELADWRTAAKLTPRMRDNLIATGFLRCSADFTDENELNTLPVRYGILHRTAESLAGNLLGLTMQCCKCHDHKFEPLAQRDYYRFSAILAPALNPKSWLQPAARQLSGLGTAEQAEFDSQSRRFTERQNALRDTVSARLLVQKLNGLPEQIREDAKTAQQTPAEKRNEVQRYLADKFSKAFQNTNEEVQAAMTVDEKKSDVECTAGIARLKEQQTDAVLQAVYDSGPASTVYVLRRGDYETPGASVKPGLFRVLTPGIRDLASSSDAAGATSGRRLALAQQLADWDTPVGALVARVRVNRVWQRLFGRGIVETPDNFGVAGTPPTHPQLLDWLAGDFVQNGGRLKPLLKRIMTSTVYRQSAMSRGGESPANPREVDPDNKLLWRQRLRRLESEIVRDTMLVASGRLDRTVGGKPIGIENRPDGMVVEAGAKEPPADKLWRRSMYLLQRRNYHLSLLAAFDQPLLTGNCTRRDTSAVVSQSLMMLNDQFVLRQADHLAARVRRESPAPTVEQQIDFAFRLVLARPPREDELQWCVETHARHLMTYQAAGLKGEQPREKALAQICHMLLNTSEFLYIQ